MLKAFMCGVLAQDNVPPDEHLFAALFTTAAAGRTPDLLDLAAEAGPQMQRCWASLRKAASTPESERWGWCWLHADMSLRPVQAASWHANGLKSIDSYALSHHRALFLPPMRASLCRDDRQGKGDQGFLCVWRGRGWRIAYNALLNLHAKAGQAAEAEALFQGMLAAGPHPDRVSINTTISAHAQASSLLPHPSVGMHCLPGACCASSRQK
jgi:pentatricopeptide repeat protein